MDENTITDSFGNVWERRTGLVSDLRDDDFIEIYGDGRKVRRTRFDRSYAAVRKVYRLAAGQPVTYRRLVSK